MYGSYTFYTSDVVIGIYSISMLILKGLNVSNNILVTGWYALITLDASIPIRTAHILDIPINFSHTI